MKYDFPDARYVLERASARESAARVACGAMAKMLLRALGVEVASHVVRVGKAELSRPATFAEIAALQEKDEVLLNCVDAEDEQRMKAEVDAVLRTGDTIGGVFEVVVHGLAPGVGTHANWDERMDGLLAQAVMSLQAVKAVELGRGVTAAESLAARCTMRLDMRANRVYSVFAGAEQCGRDRGWNLEWRRCGGARVSEADLDAAEAAGVGELCDA